MAKAEFKIENKNNFTAEEIIGFDVSVKCENGNIIPIGIVSKVDEEYIYIDFEHNNDNNMIIEVNKNASCSIEIAGD